MVGGRDNLYIAVSTVTGWRDNLYVVVTTVTYYRNNLYVAVSTVTGLRDNLYVCDSTVTGCRNNVNQTIWLVPILQKGNISENYSEIRHADSEENNLTVLSFNFPFSC